MLKPAIGGVLFTVSVLYVYGSIMYTGPQAVIVIIISWCVFKCLCQCVLMCVVALYVYA